MKDNTINTVKSLGYLCECLNKFQKMSDPETPKQTVNEIRADIAEALKGMVDIVSNEKYGLDRTDLFGISHAMECKLRHLFLTRLIGLAREFRINPNEMNPCPVCAENATAPPSNIDLDQMFQEKPTDTTPIEVFYKNHSISGVGKGELYGRTGQEDRNTD